MSVILKCPNCHTSIGEASHENNYKELFCHKNLDGTPICNSCGNDNDSFKFVFWFCVILIFSVVTLSIIF